MTTFLNGPAAGQHLLLKASPKILRVVRDAYGKWDALDQPGDQPRANEDVFVYELAEHVGNCHINMGRGGCGFYPISKYRLKV